MLTFKDFVNESILSRTLIEEAKKRIVNKAEMPKMKDSDLTSLLDDLENGRRWIGFPENKINFSRYQLSTLEKFMNADPEIKSEMENALKVDGRADLTDELSSKYLPEGIKKVLIKVYQKYNGKTGTAEEKNPQIAEMAFAILLGNDSYQLNKRMFSQANIYYGYNIPRSTFYDQLVDGYIRGLELYNPSAGASPSTFIVQNSVANYLKNSKRTIDPALKNSTSLDDTASSDPHHADKDMSIEELTPDENSNLFNQLDQAEQEAIRADMFDTLPELDKELLTMAAKGMTLAQMNKELREKGLLFKSDPMVRDYLNKAKARFYDRYEEVYKDKHHLNY